MPTQGTIMTSTIQLKKKKDLAEIKFGTSFKAKNKSCDLSGQVRLEATNT